MEMRNRTSSAWPGWLRTFSLVVALALLATIGAAQGTVDLSPSSWPPGDLDHYTYLQNNTIRDHPPAEGHRGMVTGTTGALAIRSGVEALRRGGSAVDAVMTTSLAQIVLMAGSTVSFAGSAALIYYESETGQVHYLNGVWDIPERQTSGDDIPPCGTSSGRQVLVHGFMAALEEAHSRFGELPFESLFGPPIYFADEGFEIYPYLGQIIDYRGFYITQSEGGREIFLKPNGARYRTGDWFRQPVLAETLTRVSREGSGYLYRGAWARELVDAVRDQGGRLSLADLENYEARWIEPLSFEFEGNLIHSTNSPELGGGYLRAAMTSLDVQTMRAAGHYTESSDSLAMLLRGIERAYGYAKGGRGETSSHSDAVVAVDRRGNVAAFLHTLNGSDYWGSDIFVDGVSISNAGCWAQWHISQAGSDRRLPTVLNPTIVTREGRPVLAGSSIGVGVFPDSFFSLVDVLVFGADPQLAVDDPAFLHPDFGSGQVTHQTTYGDFSRALLDGVRSRGFQIGEVSVRNAWRYAGQWIGIAIDPVSRVLTGATRPEWNGIAMAQGHPRGSRRPADRRSGGNRSPGSR